jgi:septal ring factor EnvC (AmiA/AmiB activator)
MNRCLAAVAMVAILAGCDSPSRTVDTARKQLAAFQAAPDSKKQAEVETSLAKLDAQIQALETQGDVAQAEILRHQSRNLHNDFQAIRMAHTIQNATKAIQDIGDAFKEAGKTFGESFKTPETNAP